MNLEQLDGVLRLWRNRLSSIADNLLELQSQTTYQQLTGTGGLERTELSGTTAAEVYPALREVRNLFVWFGLLQATVERAELLRRDIPSFFGAEIRLRQVQQILFTRTIPIEEHEVPFAARGLLSRTVHRQMLSPEELLALMMQRFSAVRDVLTSIERTWTEVGRQLQQTETEVQSLYERSASVQSSGASRLDEVQASLKQVRKQVAHDPMGAVQKLRNEVDAGLKTVRAEMGKGERVKRDLELACQRWPMCKGLHEAAVARWKETQASVRAGRLLPEPSHAGKIRDLEIQLHDLCERQAGEPVDVTMNKLRLWWEETERVQTQNKRVLDACEDQLALRSELRRRMDALQAEVQASGRALYPHLPGLGERAERLLNQQPLDVRSATEAVASFEQALRGASATPHARYASA